MVFNQFFVGLLTILVTIVTMAELISLWWWRFWSWPFIPVDCSFCAKRSYTLFQKQTKARGLQTQLIEESLTQESLIQSFNAQDQFRTALKDEWKLCQLFPIRCLLFFNCQPCHSLCECLDLCSSGWIWGCTHYFGSHFTVGQLVTS